MNNDSSQKGIGPLEEGCLYMTLLLSATSGLLATQAGIAHLVGVILSGYGAYKFYKQSEEAHKVE